MEAAARVLEARRQALAALPQRLREAEPLRQQYLALVREHRAPATENLQDRHAWTVYVYFTDLVARLVPPGRRIVDWGGGYGHVTALLRRLGRDAHNYHVYPPSHYAPFAAALAIPDLHGKDPNRLALADASVDALISSGVLEHVREDGVGREEAILAEVHRVLRPGGWFFVWNLPCTLAPSDLVGKARGVWYHEYRYAGAEVRRLLRGAGFEVLALERYGANPLGLALKPLGDRAAAPAFLADRAFRWLWPFPQNFAVVARRPT